MNAILSIKPQFVEEIVAGRKKYEFRKKGFKKPVKKVYVYATTPVCKIIGEFELGDVLEGNPSKIWDLTYRMSGITEEYYKKYYCNNDIAYALEIKSFKSYKEPINPYLTLGKFTPPQSFCYFNRDFTIWNKSRLIYYGKK